VVADDGRGFVLSEQEARSDHLLHIGLETMTERVRLAGGELEVDSSPGGGTRISFEVPMALDSAEIQRFGESASSSASR
jgi:signal transduction histidine kinase